MSKSAYTTSPIDHYIQAQIVQMLYAATSPLSFSILKPDDIENSLFMYHMRKLSDRGLIRHDDNGYSLTTTGNRWVNFIGPSSLQPKMMPRVLINFIITDPAKTRVLLSRRKGLAAQELNEYLLPGDLHEYGHSLPDAAAAVLANCHISGTARYLGIFESIKTLPDGFIHHTISLLHELTHDGPSPEESAHYAYEWVSLTDIHDEKYERPIADILTRYLQNSVKAFETVSFSHT